MGMPGGGRGGGTAWVWAGKDAGCGGAGAVDAPPPDSARVAPSSASAIFDS